MSETKYLNQKGTKWITVPTDKIRLICEEENYDKVRNICYYEQFGNFALTCFTYRGKMRKEFWGGDSDSNGYPIFQISAND